MLSRPPFGSGDGGTRDREYNADFSQRIVIRPGDGGWSETGMPGIRYKLLEACCKPYPRRTLILDCLPGTVMDSGDIQLETEFLVLHGEVTDDSGTYPAGTYVRNPVGTRHANSETGCRLFVKLSQIHEEDQGHRIIDTCNNSNWLPGPSEHTRVFPLHVWDTESVILLRWDEDDSIKPALDPQGEEIFVVSGELRDSEGSYPQHSWIRNPAEAWQQWSASGGTVIYYKTGHFPDDV
ncbi:cupin domain-containing protein [Granulosicoccaceae sp. 1_MG-2023]|nr:cupin domain-containing protein [Granulosicoccaceae sp. 1_MG-2023]